MIGVTLPLALRPRQAAAPPNPFPAALMAAGGVYHHFAAEDAGETWATRNGTGLSLQRRGNPTQVAVSGLTMLDCTLGAYELVRGAGWAADTPFTLWILAEHNTLSGRAIYNGPALYEATPAALSFRPNAMSALAGGSTLSFTLRSSDPVRSYEWSRLGAGSLTTVMRAYENAIALTASNSSTGLTDASGTVLVVGGSRSSSGSVAYAKLRLRDLVLTQGWVLNATQRAALDSYRLARLAG